MKVNYPYLKDKEFIKLVDTQHLQNHYVKIILLDWNENPLQEIQGIATGGSISINGNSSVRRTCSLSMIVKNVSDGKISDADNLISINKKIFLEIGVENKTGKYTKEYPIIWFPQGTFIFTSCSISTSVGNGTTLSGQLKDKMCLLNGECGGTLTASVQLDKYDTIDESGKIITVQPTISQIIRELVNHLGGEDLAKIIISGLDERVKLTMRWLGSSPIYLHKSGNNYSYEIEKQDDADREFNYGDDIGYVYTDFTYPTELIANQGETITSILDKIRDLLGNFEYFYDIDGLFHFQEIQNFLNTTEAKTELDKIEKGDYLVDLTKGKTEYDFSTAELITSYSNSPQYNKIKNDYVVWGIRKNAEGVSVPIRYHLALDEKPAIGNIYDVFFYIDPDDGIEKAKAPIKYQSRSNFPKLGAEGLFYMDMSTNTIYSWDSATKSYRTFDSKTTVTTTNLESIPRIERNEDTIYILVDVNDTSIILGKYCWGFDITSSAYKNGLPLIASRRQQYEDAVKVKREQIDRIRRNQIAPLEEQLQELDEIMSPILSRKRYYQNQLASYQKELEYRTVELEQREQDKVDLEAKVNNYNIEIARLQAAIDAETDPNKKAELESQKNTIMHLKENTENEIIELDQLIAQTNQQIIELNSNIATCYNQITSINEELAPYETQKAEYENLLSIEELRVKSLISEIDGLRIEFDADLAILEDNQRTFIEISTELQLVKVKTTDWRSELYLQGVVAEPLGVSSNYYYTELEAEWPKLYDLKKTATIVDGEIVYEGDFRDKFNIWNVDYFLDFIDTDSELRKLNVNNIGRRSIVENKDSFNCVFESDIPDIVLIETGQDDTEQKREECITKGQPYVQVESEMCTNIATGGLHKSCFSEIKNLLWNYTSYSNSIQLGVVPIYHLEPNTRITVRSVENDIAGDFIIGSISLPLTVNGNMSINATKAEEKL